MAGTHRHASGGHRLAADELRGVREESFKDGSAEAGPDEASGDVFVRRVELVEVGVGLPLLEEQLDLPSKPVKPRNETDGERRARQVRAEPSHGGFVAGQDDDAEAKYLLAALVLDVEIHLPAGVLLDEPRQSRRLPQRDVHSLQPGRRYPWIVASA